MGLGLWKLSLRPLGFDLLKFELGIGKYLSDLIGDGGGVFVVSAYCVSQNADLGRELAH